jgi:hypothetical protein
MPVHILIGTWKSSEKPTTAVSKRSEMIITTALTMSACLSPNSIMNLCRTAAIWFP